MPRLHQILLAVVFLTRLPLGRFLPARVLPLTDAVWAFPLVGALVGALASVPLWLGASPLLSATLSVALAVWLTGALHEDALADFADAAGGQTLQDRLRIMRDSRIGSYGVVALVLVMALRITALAALGPAALIAATTMGRAGIVVAMAALPPARTDGLGHSAGRASVGALTVALTIAVLAAIPAGAVALAGAAAAALVTAALIRRAARWLGGQTGDVLGATCICVETAALVTMACLA